MQLWRTLLNLRSFTLVWSVCWWLLFPMSKEMMGFGVCLLLDHFQSAPFRGAMSIILLWKSILSCKCVMEICDASTSSDPALAFGLSAVYMYKSTLFFPSSWDSSLPCTHYLLPSLYMMTFGGCIAETPYCTSPWPKPPLSMMFSVYNVADDEWVTDATIWSIDACILPHLIFHFCWATWV